MSTAAITVVSGINGAGKTLFLLQEVRKLQEESKKEKDADGVLKWPQGRPVYYFAIPGIAEAGVLGDWTEIQPFDRKSPDSSKLNDPAIVHKLPQDSIIVIDEAHRSFGKTAGNTPPSYIQDFDMIRHDGKSVYFCTQNPADLHQFIRARIGKHYHCKRVFGLERSTIYEWEEYGDIKSTKSIDLALKREFPFPKEVYGWYRSADSHTVQKKFPWKKVAPVLFIIPGVIAICWYVVHRIEGKKSPQPPTPVQLPDAPKTARTMQASIETIESTRWRLAGFIDVDGQRYYIADSSNGPRYMPAESCKRDAARNTLCQIDGQIVAEWTGAVPVQVATMQPPATSLFGN